MVYDNDNGPSACCRWSAVGWWWRFIQCVSSFNKDNERELINIRERKRSTSLPLLINYKLELAN